MANIFDSIGPGLVDLLINNSPLGPVTGQYTSVGTVTRDNDGDTTPGVDKVETINTTPFLKYKPREVDDKTILKGDTFILIDQAILVDFKGNGPVVPKINDFYLKDNRKFNVEAAQPTYGGDNILYWKIQLREGPNT